MENIQVHINEAAIIEQQLHEKELIIEKLKSKIQEISATLECEQKLRQAAEQRVKELEEMVVAKRRRRTKAEMEAARTEASEYSEFKKNGVRKKQKTVGIRSYDDYKKIDDYFRSKGQLRNSVMWTVGICLGVRASDLCSLKWKNVLNEDFTFRNKIFMYEQKTGKLQNCFITEAIVKYLTEYLNSIRWSFDMEDQIFPIVEKHCWRILKNAAAEVGIEYNIGSHSMRQSFANIALCVDKNTIDMNAITKVQGMLNHSDPRVTMKYLGTLDDMYDKARETVSDFVLGKTGVNELIAGNKGGIADVFEKLLAIEEKLS